MSENISNTACQPQVHQSTFRRMLKDPLTLIGITLMAIIVIMVLIGPFILKNDPLTVNMSERFKFSSWQYPLGTDQLGRCIFTRLIIGAQTTLGIATIVIFTVILIGVPLGLFSGYVGGRVDVVIMRFLDGISALPEFLLAIAISGFLGPSVGNLMFSIILVKWSGYARVVRSIVLSEREKGYVMAAKVSGSRTWTILWKHLLPQIVSPVLVLAALDVGKVILIISSLSYLGLGAQPPAAEWGAMLNDGRPYFQTIPQLMIYPGLAIMVVVISCNLISDGIRDILDVRSR